MSFLIHPKSKEFFSTFKSTDNKTPIFKDLFDLYYYCFLLGVSSGEREPSLEGAYEVTKNWPNSYSGSKLPIINLLIFGYMLENGYEVDNKTFANKILSKLIDHNNKNDLSEEGYKRMNEFAYNGFEILLKKHPFPTSGGKVLIDITSILKENFDKAPWVD